MEMRCQYCGFRGHAELRGTRELLVMQHYHYCPKCGARCEPPTLLNRSWQSVLGAVLCMAVALCIGIINIPTDNELDAIENAGGKVLDEQGYPPTIRRRATKMRVTFNATVVSDSQLACLDTATRVIELRLVKEREFGESRITDAGLSHLRGLTSLQRLDLPDLAITDQGVKQLTRLTDLRSLDLAYNQVTDVGLSHLQSLTNLTDLDLSFTKVTDEGVKELQQALPRLVITWRHF